MRMVRIKRMDEEHRGLDEGGEYNAQKIITYGRQFFYVKTEKKHQPSVTVIDTDGDFVGRQWTVPDLDNHKTPLWTRTSLINAETRKAGFV